MTPTPTPLNIEVVATSSDWLNTLLGLAGVLIAVLALYWANLRRAEIVLFPIEYPASPAPHVAGGQPITKDKWHGFVSFTAYNNGARGGLLDGHVSIDLDDPTGAVADYGMFAQLITDGTGGPKALEAGDMIICSVQFSVKWNLASDERADLQRLRDLIGATSPPEMGATFTYMYTTQRRFPFSFTKAQRQVNGETVCKLSLFGLRASLDEQLK